MIDFYDRKLSNISSTIDCIVKKNGGRIAVCNKLGITTVALQAYRQGKLKMTGKVKDKFLDIYGLYFRGDFMIKEYLEAILIPVIVFLGAIIFILTFVGMFEFFYYTSYKHSADFYNRKCHSKVKLKPYDFASIYVDWRTCKIKNKWSSNE